jgi:hypothetical protein
MPEVKVGAAGAAGGAAGAGAGGAGDLEHAANTLAATKPAHKALLLVVLAGSFFTEHNSNTVKKNG